MRDIAEIVHVNYPHEPGYLYDCQACEAECHCEPGGTECVWSGHDETGITEHRHNPAPYCAKCGEACTMPHDN